MMEKIVLASGSPRRKELMEQAGIPFVVQVSECEEKITSQKPEEVVLELSHQKACAVADEMERETIVVGADTVVALDGIIMGKPQDREDAFQMLKKLQGRTHHVWTGVTILECRGKEIYGKESFARKTEVEMYPMEEEEIWDYINTGEPMDKAGAYAIQGKALVFVKEIRGDYYNVVGLPIAELYQRLKKKIRQSH